ncbi:MAG TPA: glycoside hydrolase family 1 protein [Verrucomicrobiae bacterium]|nr:glycoside hydrolase family 1 protein [Verrucomicrobiae bacterium]
MDDNGLQFPSDFLWGAGTAAHQAEGFNINDWSEWETQNAARLASEAEKAFGEKVPDWESIRSQAVSPSNYISGRAADHYTRYKEDVKLAKQLGLRALKFSIEWSRIEPHENQYNQEAIDHYVDFVRELKKNEIDPVIVLHHRTNPLWVRDQGDWLNPKTVLDFIRYSKKIVSLFKNDVRIWIPINEPIMSTTGGYIGGVYPPGKKSIYLGYKVYKNYVKAQNEAYKLIHSIVSNPLVGLSHAAVLVDPYNNRWINKLAVKLADYFGNFKIMNETLYDFIGVQYYSKAVIDVRFTPSLLPKVEEVSQAGVKSDMGWTIYAPGIYEFIKKIVKYKKPIMITENGIADQDDKLRFGYIEKHLAWIHKAIEEGVDVRGYFYWALTDNMEWNKGFWPRFGLIEVNYNDYTRKIRKSAIAFSEIIKNNGLNNQNQNEN